MESNINLTGRQLLAIRAALLVLRGRMPIHTFKLFADGYCKHVFTSSGPFQVSGIYTNAGRRVAEKPGGGFLALTSGPCGYDIADIARILVPYSVDATNNLDAFVSAITCYLDKRYGHTTN